MKIKCYHVSHRSNRASIKEKGLLLMEKTDYRIKYSPRIFFSTSKYELAFDYVNFEGVDVWEFEIESHLLKKDEFSYSKNHFFIEQKIGADELSLIGSY